MYPIIVVKAKIRVLTEAEGGRRKAPIYSGYSPNHVFEKFTPGEMMVAHGGIIVLTEPINPGEEREVIVRFLKTPIVEKYIIPGREWQFNEGAAIIGTAQIIEILPA